MDLTMRVQKIELREQTWNAATREQETLVAVVLHQEDDPLPTAIATCTLVIEVRPGTRVFDVGRLVHLTLTPHDGLNETPLSEPRLTLVVPDTATNTSKASDDRVRFTTTDTKTT
jgi:hypothetical protein